MAKFKLLELRAKIQELYEKRSICNRLIDKVFEQGTVYRNDDSVTGEVNINSPTVVQNNINVTKTLESIDFILDKLENINTKIASYEAAIAKFEAISEIEIENK